MSVQEKYFHYPLGKFVPRKDADDFMEAIEFYRKNPFEPLGWTTPPHTERGKRLLPPPDPFDFVPEYDILRSQKEQKGWLRASDHVMLRRRFKTYKDWVTYNPAPISLFVNGNDALSEEHLTSPFVQVNFINFDLDKLAFVLSTFGTSEIHPGIRITSFEEWNENMKGLL